MWEVVWLLHPTHLRNGSCPIFSDPTGPEWIDAVLQREKVSELSYDIVGHAALGPPGAPWEWHEQQMCIGAGEDIWAKACAALTQWTQFKCHGSRRLMRPFRWKKGLILRLYRSRWGYGASTSAHVYTVNEQDERSTRLGCIWDSLLGGAWRENFCCLGMPSQMT